MDLRAENQKLRQENQKFREENQSLKNQLNSQTSHFPSSKTIIKPIVSLREPSGKKSGGQLGRLGTTLERSSNPDEIIDYKPSTCLQCGNNLAEERMELSASRQVFDIPPIPRQICTEHRVYQVKCSCGHMAEGQFPPYVTAPVQYGVNTTAMVSYLSTFQYLPYKRLCELMKITYGIDFSEGSVENLLKKSVSYLQPIYNQINERLVQSKVVGGDETGLSINGQKGWMFGFQTPKLTYLKASLTRGFSTISDTFANGFPHSIYVSDCLPMQLKVEARKHQICLAHLLREVKGFIKGHEEKEWSPKFYALLCEAYELKKQAFICPQRIKTCEQSLENLLLHSPTNNNKIQAFVKRLKKNRSAIFTFLYHKDVPPDNNGTERVIRNVKVKMKVSGFFKSFDGAQNFAVIRSVVDTILKNNQNLFDIFAQIHKCNYQLVSE